jgi:hypothetical protein
MNITVARDQKNQRLTGTKSGTSNWFLLALAAGASILSTIAYLSYYWQKRGLSEIEDIRYNKMN